MLQILHGDSHKISRLPDFMERIVWFQLSVPYTPLILRSSQPGAIPSPKTSSTWQIKLTRNCLQWTFIDDVHVFCLGSFDKMDNAFLKDHPSLTLASFSLCQTSSISASVIGRWDSLSANWRTRCGDRVWEVPKLRKNIKGHNFWARGSYSARRDRMKGK